jgi:alpha-L-arabinofuranosidase
MLIRYVRFPALAAGLIMAVQSGMAQANLPFYTDNLVNAFQDWSWSSTRNFANTSPVHSGTNSLSITITGGGGALSLQYQAGFNTAPYASLSFWVNGGTTGGQRLQAVGSRLNVGQTAYALPKLPTNGWQQITIPLSSLGVANVTNFSGIYIQDTSGGAQPVFYMDDIQLNAAPAPALVHVGVDVTKTNRTADARWFGVNTATWDSYLSQTSTTSNLLKQAGFMSLRWPGGSTADAYHWTSDSTGNSRFNTIATGLGITNAFITVNYGSGSSNEAASWVRSDNLTNHCGYKYWEIGNECYGTWENDTNSAAHDPYTYAVRAAGYIAMMKAADPTIKIGVVAAPGEDSYSNNAAHPVVNPRTGVTHYGWTPVMLTYLKNMGATPDFLVHHVYPEYTATTTPPPAADSDPLLLQSTVNWAQDAANLRQMISDYIGAPGTNIQLCCTENNSDSSSAFGKQLTSIVNALYLVDSTCQIMKTEFNSYIWWDLRNGPNSSGTFDPTIYGWRTYGDEGILNGASSPYPTYYGEKILQFFVRPGDTVLNATSDYLLLSAYAARKADGTLALLVINKDVTTNFNAQIAISNFLPSGTATVRSYGINQDEATRTNNTTPGSQDISTNSIVVSGVFTNSFPPGSVTVLTFSPAPSVLPTTLVLTSGVNPSTYGNSVTFTATVQTNAVAVGNIGGETVAFYNGGTSLGTGTLNASGQAAYTTSATQLAAGTNSITAIYGGDSNYLASTNSPALSQTINQVSLTAGLIGAVTKTYDGTTAATLAPINYTLSGVVSGDTVTLNNPASGSFDTRNVGSGKTVTVAGLAISGASVGNYALSSSSVSAAIGTIVPTNITVTAAANNKFYDTTTGAATLPVITAGSVQNGDTANFIEAYGGSNVGIGLTLTPSGIVSDGNSGNNYGYSFVSNANGTIQPATLTYTAISAIMSYGSAVPVVNGTVSGFAGSETQGSVTTGTLLFTTTATSSSGAGSYPITGSGLTANNGNYQFAQATGNATALTINAANLSVTNLLAPDKIYDGTTNAPLDASNAGLAGILNGDSVTLVSSNAVGHFADKTVGTNKPVTVNSLSLAGDEATNYAVLQPTNVTGNITSAGLTVGGVNAANKYYDGTTVATLSGTTVLLGVITGDDVSLITSNAIASFADSNVGTNIPVTVTGYAVTGADAGNYVLAQPVGLAANIITPPPVFTGISIVSGNAQITFSGPVGANYTLLSSPDLSVPVSQWTVAATGTFASGPVTIPDSVANSTQKFYVIVLH